MSQRDVLDLVAGHHWNLPGNTVRQVACRAVIQTDSALFEQSGEQYAGECLRHAGNTKMMVRAEQLAALPAGCPGRSGKVEALQRGMQRQQHTRGGVHRARQQLLQLVFPVHSVIASGWSN